MYPEQILACMFSKIKLIISHNNINNNEVSIGLPSYLGVCERKLVSDAANMSGLKVISMLNDSSAIALFYGFYRRMEIAEKEARHVVFVDFGHSKTSVFLVKFTRTEAEIVNEVVDKNLGARDIDLFLMNKML